jgi:protein phosphatase
MPHVSSAAATDAGLRRPANEDAFSCRDDLGLYIVADGMGGHAAGEVASRLAVDVIETFVTTTRSRAPAEWPFERDPTLRADANLLIAAFHTANQRLNDAVAADHALKGMATTAVAVLVSGNDATVAHVGDSRVYLWRDEALRRLTQDHSWVGEQVRAGMLTDADAQRHPWRNVVTRAIAGGVDPDVDVSELTLAPGDRLLLCSDGLSGVVPHEQLERICAERRRLAETCAALIAAANDAGGPDNITILMLQIDVA